MKKHNAIRLINEFTSRIWDAPGRGNMGICPVLTIVRRGTYTDVCTVVRCAILGEVVGCVLCTVTGNDAETTYGEVVIAFVQKVDAVNALSNGLEKFAWEVYTRAAGEVLRTREAAEAGRAAGLAFAEAERVHDCAAYHAHWATQATAPVFMDELTVAPPVAAVVRSATCYATCYPAGTCDAVYCGECREAEIDDGACVCNACKRALRPMQDALRTLADLLHPECPVRIQLLDDGPEYTVNVDAAVAGGVYEPLATGTANTPRAAYVAAAGHLREVAQGHIAQIELEMRALATLCGTEVL